MVRTVPASAGIKNSGGATTEHFTKHTSFDFLTYCIEYSKMYERFSELKFVYPNNFCAVCAQSAFARPILLPIPTVCSINGHAFGAGMMFAIAHDYLLQRQDRGYQCAIEIAIGIRTPPPELSLFRHWYVVRPSTGVQLIKFAFPGFVNLFFVIL